MSESADGLDVTVTRQNGTLFDSVGPFAAAAGRVKPCASTLAADVTVACGSVRLVRLSQAREVVSAAADWTWTSVMRTAAAVAMRIASPRVGVDGQMGRRR